MEFVFEVGVGLLEARTILEELHEPLLVRTHSAPVRTSFEKTKLIDQSPALAASVQLRDIPNKPVRSWLLEVMPPLGTIFQPFI